MASRRKLLSSSLALAVLALLAAAPLAHAVPFAPEEAHSPNAEDATSAYWVMFVLGVVAIAAVNLALVGAVVRFRARRGREPARVRSGRRVQARAASAFAVLAIAIFVFGIVSTGAVRDVEPSGAEGLEAASGRTAQLGLEPPAGDAEPLRILASGQQWVWRFEYPDGTFSYYELVVPVDTTVLLQLDSTDVVHRWSMPELGGNFDAVPGRSNETWFRADDEGTYDGQSAAFSGPGYATMRARVRAVSVPEYEAWLQQQGADLQDAQNAVQEEVGGEAAAGGDEAGATP